MEEDGGYTWAQLHGCPLAKADVAEYPTQMTDI